MEKNFNEIVNHLIINGFFYPNSQIYGGLANTWDYGPLGVEMKRNLKNIWWKYFVRNHSNVVGLDSAIISNPQTWKASGHLKNFQDPLIDCKSCKNRYRMDELVESQASKLLPQMHEMPSAELITRGNITCPGCQKQDFTDVRFFNLMFKTQHGVLENDKNALYLRPETTQGIFTNFKNIVRSSRLNIPFGVGQMGKSFRNEITPNNFIFRTREFEQMEIAFFCEPPEAPQWFDFWLNEIKTFLSKIKIDSKNIMTYEHNDKELAHYAHKTIDFKYHFPFGWQELWGLSNRADFDLKNHTKNSQENLFYQDPKTKEKYLPFVIEPSVGVERLLLAVMCDAYTPEILENHSERLVMKLPWTLSPYQIMVTPLFKKLDKPAWEIFQTLISKFRVTYDKTGSVGKRYRRADAIGVNYVVTYDFDSVDNKEVTVRDRDSMKQTRIKINRLINYFEKIETKNN